MKRFLVIITTLFIILNFSACSNTKNEKNIKIGVIDSCISSKIQDKYDITKMNDIVGVQTNNNITHGSMILSIIKQNVSNCEIFYCSVYDENCIGKIDDVATAINWCVDNNVDIITMSFATLTDEVSFLTAYVCGKIANQLSEGNTVEEVVKDLNFD